jgi:hypothetical protein
MDSQNFDNWKLSLLQLLDDPIQFFQPSTSKQHMQDEAKTSEHLVQLYLDLIKFPTTFINKLTTKLQEL